MIDTKAMSRLLCMSMRTFYKLLTMGAVPKPLTFGRAHRWALEEILAWVDSGCPPADRWKQIRQTALREYRALFSAKTKTGR